MRSRSHPWWERCDVVGHALEVPCQFCVSAQKRKERLAQERLVFGGFEPGLEVHVDLSNCRGWTSWYPRLDRLDSSILS